MPKAPASQFKRSLFWLGFMVILAIVPVAFVLMALGLWFALQQGWLFWLLGASLFSLMLVWLTSQLWLRQTLKPKPALNEALQSSELPGHWSDLDKQAWQAQQGDIQQRVAANPDWQDLPSEGLALVQQVAEHYGKHSEYQFSVPEALRLCEEISRRYRLLLLDQVPFIEQAKVSYFKAGLDQKGRIKTGYKAYQLGFNLYRAFRTLNPVAALIGEARNLVLNQVGQKLLTQADQSLKTALLNEVCRTAIDLYGGHFGELSQAEAPLDATEPLAPVRVTVIGQPSSGKSSLVNALCQAVNAEVSPLPSTEDYRLYQCQLTEDCELEICDLPGLSDQPKQQQALLKEVCRSDLVIWVLKANQPSRQLDGQFKALLEQHQQAHPDKKPPVQIGVLNQIDRLLTQDQLPALAQPDPSHWPDVIAQAQAYNQSIMGFEPIPIQLCPQQINLNSLLASIELHYQEALHTQLNRRRTQNPGLAKQWQRTQTLGKTLFRQIRGVKG